MRLLDLFCCEGGASMGYHRAGFDVYGIDLFRHRGPDGKLRGYRRQRYPFPAVQGDALDLLQRLTEGERLAFDDGETTSLSSLRLPLVRRTRSPKTPTRRNTQTCWDRPVTC
jgi:hypothetical protein